MRLPEIVVEPIYGEAHPFDGRRTIGWRARIGNEVIVERGYKTWVIEWLNEHYPKRKQIDIAWGIHPPTVEKVAVYGESEDGESES